jgi:membrane-bound ClpP family serine protease
MRISDLAGLLPNVMDSNATFAILLLLTGIGILVAEVFIPSGGLLGIITFVSLTMSVVFAYRAWGTTHPNYFIAFCGAILVLVPTALGTAFYILPKTSMGKKILLEGPDAEYLTPFASGARHLQELIGQYGLTVSPLTPGGLVVVNGERLHAISEGIIIDAEKSVEVIEVHGTRLLVRPAERPAVNAGTSTEPPSRLDFEIPQS